MQSNHSRRNKIIGAVCLVICLFLIFELLYWWQVEDVRINGIQEESPEAQQIRDYLDNARIILLSEYSVQQEIEQQIPKLIVNEIDSDIPYRTVVVSVQMRSDRTCINAANGKVYTDSSGIIYTLPVEKDCFVFYDDYLYEGDLITDSRLRSALWYSDLVENIVYVNDRITSTIEGVDVLFPSVEKYEDAENTVNLLQKVVQKYTIEGKRIERLDLRFSDPVIKFK